MPNTRLEHAATTSAPRTQLRVYCSEIAPLRLADGTPLYLYWIIEDEDGTLHRVPSEPGGWLRRSPFRGELGNLRSVPPEAAGVILRLTCAEVSGSPAAVTYAFERYQP